MGENFHRCAILKLFGLSCRTFSRTGVRVNDFHETNMTREN